MTPEKLLITSGLLGLFALAGGCYGALFAFGKSWRREPLVNAARVCYVVQLAITVAIALDTPLLWYWKVFIVLSSIAYGFIPPTTMRYLVRLHQSSELKS